MSVVIATLKACEPNKEVARAGCLTLCNISAGDVGRDACVASGAVHTFIGALRTHGIDPDTSHFVYTALLNIGYNPSYRTGLLKAGVLLFLEQARYDHPEESETGITVYKALSVFAQNDAEGEAVPSHSLYGGHVVMAGASTMGHRGAGAPLPMFGALGVV